MNSFNEKEGGGVRLFYDIHDKALKLLANTERKFQNG
jgi:hypothetical protein